MKQPRRTAAAMLLLVASGAYAQAQCADDGGNWYCALVNAITYTGVGGEGSYNKITNMDSTSGACSSEPFGYSGSLSPLNEPVSWHFRGPIELKQFASYTPGAASTKKKAKRSRHARRHAHGHRHKAKRAVGDIVTATINGDVVSWTDEYAGPTTSTAAPDPAYTPSPYSMPDPQASAGTSIAPDNTTISNAWGRNGFYCSDSQTSEGIVFLNHFGGTGSGVFDYSFGNSLSYATCDGLSGASSPQILEATTLPSTAEVVIMTDRQCQDDSCGYVRPGTVAYEGFDGDSKAFFFEFAMPDSGETTTDIYDPVNMPAIWMLNAQIPRTLQYGNADCSCWITGCGEFDMFEVLAPGDHRAKSTLHGNKAGGDSNYFSRPVTGSIKAGMILIDDNIHIKVLDSSTSFDSEMDPAVIDEILASSSTAGPEVSLFNLADASTG